MIKKRDVSIGFAAMALAGAAGCTPRFDALTVPPPTAVAELSDEDRTIALSKGVALAFECVAQNSAPCEGATANADDPAMLAVFNGYVDLLSPSVNGGYGRNVGAQPRAIFVVLGRAVGKTTLHIVSDDGDADFTVDIAGRASSP